MHLYPEEYWNLEADLLLKGNKKPLVAKYYGNRDSKGGKAVIRNKEELDQILSQLEGCKYEVEEVKERGAGKEAPSRLQPVPCSRKPPRYLTFPHEKPCAWPSSSMKA